MQAEAALMCAYFREFRCVSDATAPFLKKLGKADGDLVERWMEGPTSYAINRSMRAGTPSPDALHFMRLFSIAPRTKVAKTYYRSVSGSHATDLLALSASGGKLAQAGFTAVSIRPDWPLIIAGWNVKDAVLMEVTVPSGTPFVFVSGHGEWERGLDRPRTKKDHLKTQAEIVLPPATYMLRKQKPRAVRICTHGFEANLPLLRVTVRTVGLLTK